MKNKIEKVMKEWLEEPVFLSNKMIDIYENPTKYSCDREIKSFNDVHEKPEERKVFKSKFIGGKEWKNY